MPQKIAPIFRKPLKLPAKNPAITPRSGSAADPDDPSVTAAAVKRDEKRTTLTNALFAIFVALTNYGTMWTAACASETYLEEVRPTFMDGWPEAAALESALETIELWKTFAEEIWNPLANSRFPECSYVTGTLSLPGFFSSQETLGEPSLA